MRNINIQKVNPNICTLCQNCQLRNICSVTTIEECSWLSYGFNEIHDQLFNLAENTTKLSSKDSVPITFSQDDWKYYWKYIMKPWEKVCTIILITICSIIGLFILYWGLSILSFIFKIIF